MSNKIDNSIIISIKEKILCGIEYQDIITGKIHHITIIRIYPKDNRDIFEYNISCCVSEETLSPATKAYIVQIHNVLRVYQGMNCVNNEKFPKELIDENPTLVSIFILTQMIPSYELFSRGTLSVFDYDDNNLKMIKDSLMKKNYVVYKNRLYYNNSLKKYRPNRILVSSCTNEYRDRDITVYIVGRHCFEINTLKELIPCSIEIDDDYICYFRNKSYTEKYLAEMNNESNRIIILDVYEKPDILWKTRDEYQDYIELIKTIIQENSLDIEHFEDCGDMYPILEELFEH